MKKKGEKKKGKWEHGYNLKCKKISWRAYQGETPLEVEEHFMIPHSFKVSHVSKQQ